MVNDTNCFQIRGIDSNIWYEFTKNIHRKILDKNKKYQNRNLEEYFKALIYKLSKLNEDDKNSLVEIETKIEVIKK